MVVCPITHEGVQSLKCEWTYEAMDDGGHLAIDFVPGDLGFHDTRYWIEELTGSANLTCDAVSVHSYEGAVSTYGTSHLETHISNCQGWADNGEDIWVTELNVWKGTQHYTHEQMAAWICDVIDICDDWGPTFIFCTAHKVEAGDSEYMEMLQFSGTSPNYTLDTPLSTNEAGDDIRFHLTGME